MALKDKTLHIITEFGAIILMIPFYLKILFKYKLQLFDKFGMIFIIIMTIIIDGYLLISWFMIDNENNNVSMIKKLIRQSSRYSQASRQDSNNLIAVLHGNYGAAYYFALKDLFDDNEIDKVFGSTEKRKEYEKEIIHIQDTMTKKAVDDCPQYGGIIDFLSELDLN